MNGKVAGIEKKISYIISISWPIIIYHTLRFSSGYCQLQGSASQRQVHYIIRLNIKGPTSEMLLPIWSVVEAALIDYVAVLWLDLHQPGMKISFCVVLSYSSLRFDHYYSFYNSVYSIFIFIYCMQLFLNDESCVSQLVFGSLLIFVGNFSFLKNWRIETCTFTKSKNILFLDSTNIYI